MAWQNPKTDWVTNPKNPVPEDFNRIEGNIDFLKQDIETKKGLIVDAINDMNQSAQVTDTHAQLASKIRDISKDATAAVGDVEKGKTFYAGGQKRTGTLELTGNATTADVLSGKTFYNTNLKSKVTGAMPNRGAVVITPKTSNQAIQAGYHNGSGYVKGDSNLVPANIVKGKSIFGVNGSYDKTLTDLESLILHVLGLPAMPLGVSTISGRIITVETTGSVMYAPSGKTWYVLNMTEWGDGIGVMYAASSGLRISNSIPAGVTLEILEIDLPSVWHMNEAGTYTETVSKSIIPYVKSYSSSRDAILSYGTNDNHIFLKFTGDYNVSVILNRCIPVPAGNVRKTYCGFLEVQVPWQITRTTYSLYSNGESVTVGTVPYNERWLLVFTSNLSGNERVTLLFNNQSIIKGSYSAPPRGPYLIGPNTTIVAQKFGGTSEDPVNCSVTILKLKA